MQYKLGGLHPQDLASGRMLEPGEVVDLTDEEVQDPHNALLIEQEILFSIEEAENPDATDAAISAAAEFGIPLNAVTGTGQDGRITRDDVERHAASLTEAEGGGS